MFWMSDWCDVSDSEPTCHGVDVSEFISDCVLQGKELKINIPFEF